MRNPTTASLIPKNCMHCYRKLDKRGICEWCHVEYGIPTKKKKEKNVVFGLDGVSGEWAKNKK